MRFGTAIEQVKSSVPGAKGATADYEAKNAINLARRQCAGRKAWAFMLREGVARCGGAYRDAKVTVTQDSRTVTATTGTFPTGCGDWFFAVSTGNQEQYRVVSRTSGTVLVLDRPFEGDTATEQSCIVWDRYLLAPRDLYKWKSLKYERGGILVNFEDQAWFDAQWVNPQSFGDDALLMTLPERSTSARYDTGTVTIALADATVTLADGTWPEWIVDRHLQFDGEEEMYKVLSRTSDTVVELYKPYSGRFPGAGKSYELDPPGCVVLEVTPPIEDQYALKVRYYAEPELLVGMNDQLEGGDSYQAAVVAFAKAGFVASMLPSPGPDGQNPIFMQMVQLSQKHEKDAERLMNSVMGNTVAPDQFARMRNVKYMPRV